MPRGEYISARKGKPCGVCGRERWCRIHADGQQVWCSKRPNPSPPGWELVVRRLGERGFAEIVRVRAVANGDEPMHGKGGDHWLYVRDGAEIREASPAELKKQKEEDLKRDAKAVAWARKVWERGAVRHPAVIRYLADRGVPLEGVHGERLRNPALLENLRFARAVEFYEDVDDGSREKRRGTAILCGMAAGRSQETPEDLRGLVTGMQRIYVEEGIEGGWRKATTIGDPKKMLGRQYDGGCWLSYEVGDGILCVCEGVETAAAVLAATGCMTVAAMSTSGMRRFRPSPKLLERLRVIVYCGDHDRSGDGGVAMRMAVSQMHALLRESGSRVAVTGVLPDVPERAGALVLAEADENGVHAVADEKAKSVDWLDVVASGPDGIERARAAILGAAEEAVREKTVGRAGGAESGGEGGGAGGDGGGGDGGGNSGGDEDEGDEVGADYQIDDELDAQVLGHWAIPVRDEGWLILPPDDTLRALCVLRDLFARRDEKGRIVGWRVRWFAGRWYVRSRRRPIYRAVEEAELDADIARHLNLRYRRHKHVKGQEEPSVVPAAVTTRAAMQVRQAMIAFVRVAGIDSMPAWIWPDTQRDGRMRLGRPMDYDQDEHRGPFDPKMAITMESGVLDGSAWIDGRLEMSDPGPAWFAGSAVRCRLPVKEINEIGAHRTDELLAECEKRTPCHSAFLRSVFGDGDAGLCRTLLWWKYLGLVFVADTSWQLGLMVIGPRNSGKGTLSWIAESVVGKDSAYSTSISSIGQRFGLVPCVGRSLLVIPEVHIGSHTDDALGLERIKRAIGEDKLEVEAKGQNIVVSTKLTAKWLLTPNEAPHFRDSSAAIMRRFRFIKLSESFEGREDMELKSKLRAEMPWIVTYYLLGLRVLHLERREIGKRALDQPACDQWVSDAMERSVSPMRAFLADKCVLARGNRVAKSVLYEVYKAWAKEHGHGEMASNTFARQLYSAAGTVTDGALKSGLSTLPAYVNVRPRIAGERTGETEYATRVIASPSDLGMVIEHDLPT